MMLIKNPREANIILAAQKKATVEVYSEPKSAAEKAKNFQLRKCLSGDETLMMSMKDEKDLNDTLILSEATVNAENSDDEIDAEILPMEESEPKLFLTEVSSQILPKIGVKVGKTSPEVSESKVLLESHFAYEGTVENLAENIFIFALVLETRYFFLV